MTPRILCLVMRVLGVKKSNSVVSHPLFRLVSSPLWASILWKIKFFSSDLSALLYWLNQPHSSLGVPPLNRCYTRVIKLLWLFLFYCVAIRFLPTDTWIQKLLIIALENVFFVVLKQLLLESLGSLVFILQALLVATWEWVEHQLGVALVSSDDILLLLERKEVVPRHLLVLCFVPPFVSVPLQFLHDLPMLDPWTLRRELTAWEFFVVLVVE